MKKKPGPALLVGLWAGSSPAKAAELRRGQKLLEKRGFQTRLPALTQRYATKKESPARPFLAGPDRAKVQAFLQLWKDPRVQDILATRGGAGLLRLLPHFDRELKKPRQLKRVWGFSDLTTLQLYLWQRFGLPWVHSPMLSSPAFLEAKGPEARAFQKGEAPPFQEHRLRPEGGKVTVSRAVMIGGNLASILPLLSTGHLSAPKVPFYLFLEEINEHDYRFDRMLQQLSQSGFLRRCQAVLLGHLTRCERAPQMLRLWAKEEGLPLFSGIKAGHDRPNLALPMGVPVVLVPKKTKAHAVLQVPFPKLGC